MSMNSKLACTYAALILHDDGLEVTGENIAKLVDAAGIKIEKYWPRLFADMIKNRGIIKLFTEACKGGGGGGGTGPQTETTGGDNEKKEQEPEKEETPEKESSVAGPGLFSDDSSSDDDDDDDDDESD